MTQTVNQLLEELADNHSMKEFEALHPLDEEYMAWEQQMAEEGLSTQLSLLAGELTSEEMDHLTQVASAPESMANSRQSLADYIAVIRAEAIKRSGASENDLLLAAQRSNLEKKAYMEEKP